MAKVSKKSAFTGKGILNIDPDSGKLFLEVEDMDKLYDIAENVKEYDGLPVTVSISRTEDIA